MADVPRRIGLFGGTFDPPHRAHVAIALAARDTLGLDRLEVIPARRPPHRGPTAVGPYDRFAMCVLAMLGLDRIVVSPRELERSGPSYTIDTIASVEADWPGAEIVLVMGEDAYLDLPNWRHADEIVRRAHLAVVARPGAGSDGVDWRAEDLPRLAGTDATAARRVFPIPLEPWPISASAVRDALARGERPEGILDPSVVRYIEQYGLYRNPPAREESSAR